MPIDKDNYEDLKRKLEEVKAQLTVLTSQVNTTLDFVNEELTDDAWYDSGCSDWEDSGC